MKVDVFFDGGVRPFPDGGYAKCHGWWIKSGDSIIAEGKDIEIIKETLGASIVEFESLNIALSKLAEIATSEDEISVFGDAQSVIQICKGESKTNCEQMKSKKQELDLIKSNFNQIEFKWIPREQNAHADLLGRIAFDEKSGKKMRIELMNKINSKARRIMGSVYSSEKMTYLCKRTIGKARLSLMSTNELLNFKNCIQYAALEFA